MESQITAFASVCVVKIKELVKLRLLNKVSSWIPLFGEIVFEAKVAEYGVAFSEKESIFSVMNGRHFAHRINLGKFL
jgi:hypothetical protein